MPYSFDYDIEAAYSFVSSRVPGLAQSNDMNCISLKKNDTLIASVLYERFNKHNVWMHVASETKKKWFPKNFLFACFKYPFEICNVSRLSTYVNESNISSIKLNESLGFKKEARLHGAASDGGDVIIYTMFKKDCKYVKMAYN